MLLFGAVTVKRFRQPSMVQDLILTAFEEEHWPARIDDPLPPAPDLCPKRRLSDAVYRLNQHQKCRLITFEGDGTGKGITWRESDVSAADDSDRRAADDAGRKPSGRT